MSDPKLKTNQRVRNTILSAILLLTSTALALYAAEAYLAYDIWEAELGTTQRIQMAGKKAGVQWDMRSKVEVVRDLRAKGNDAFPAMAPTIFVEDNGLPLTNGRFFPFGGISRTVNVFCNESGKWSIYDSDEHGFNNPKGLWSLGKTEVALVGDSFTHGACLQPGEDIASLLRVHGFKALNLGIGGSGPLVYLGVTREYVKPLEPPLVVWLFYAGDIRDHLHEKQSALLESYLDPNFTQGLIHRQNEIDNYLRTYMNGEYQLKLEELGNARQKRREIITQRLISEGLVLTKLRKRISNLGRREMVAEGQEQAKIDLLERILTTASHEIDQWGGKMVFAYLPDWYTYGANFDSYGIEISDNFLLRNDVLTLTEKLAIPTLDIQKEVFDTHPDPLSLFNFRTYGHYTSEGYKLVAARLSDFLTTLRKGENFSQKKESLHTINME